MSLRLIAHQINKIQHSRIATTTLRPSLLPASNEVSSTFMQALRTALTHKNPVAGRFSRIADTVPLLEQRLRHYLAAINDAAFVAFSHEATQLLAAKMQNEPLSTGGYLVFAEYEHEGTAMTLIAMLSTKAQPSFDADLNLISSVMLDFEHLRYAGRIKQVFVETNEDGVIHFVSRRPEEVSDYFRDFLGCEPLTDSSSQGHQLYTALSKFSERENYNRGQKEEFMQRTHAYWKDCRANDRPMTLTGLANCLVPHDPSVVLNYLTDEAHGLAGEFPAPPPKVMKKFMKFTFAKSGLRLEFDRNDWLGNITAREHSVTIRNAPPELIRMIDDEKHVR